jgi:hypothetical protein
LVVTTTIESTIVIVPTGPSSSNSSNTGVIAGGVAGGIAVLVAVIIIFLFYWRRNRRPEESDPDRVVQHAGHLDIAGAEVTPFSYEGPPSALSGPTSPTFSADGSMQQYRDGQAPLGAGVATATSGSYYAATSSDGAASPLAGSSSHGRSNSYGSAGLAQGFPGAQPYHPSSSKEPETSRQRGEGGLGLASALEEGEGHGDVIQHLDGGRVTEPLQPNRPPQEIPPSYDSIND